MLLCGVGHYFSYFVIGYFYLVSSVACLPAAWFLSMLYEVSYVIVEFYLVYSNIYHSVALFCPMI